MTATLAQVGFVVIVAIAAALLFLAFRQAAAADRREQELFAGCAG